MAKYNMTEKKVKAPLYRALLSPKLVEELYQKIMKKFYIDKKYRDPEYSAQKLAEELGTNTRYISAVINLRFQDNYSQMVNEFRIREAQYMLKDRHNADMTMEDIAKAVGFANRQSFYAAFFRRTGTSPREFREANAQELKDKMDRRREKINSARKRKAQSKD
ncbi:MAG: helix-turn-helix domain-containing protein [Bacteroidaceae bacterium]|nr:helix-turn-helix domain-containing protein [Bacteroidaceae bacterium]